MPDGSVRPDILDETDRRIVAATQEGLPFDIRPYHVIAERLGLEPEDVMTRMRRMLETGVIRRIGAVPNHYRLGYKANGMTVWDVADEDAVEAGREIGGLDFVSHCYLRPRHLPSWPYNLFAMVHGRERSEVEDKAARVADVLGSRAKAHQILYSTKILKKTDLRLVG